MSVPPPLDPEEARARTRYLLLNAARVGGIACAIAGIAGTRGVLPLALPYWLSIVLALGGILAFFFAPPLMVKRWKAGDAER